MGLPKKKGENKKEKNKLNVKDRGRPKEKGKKKEKEKEYKKKIKEKVEKDKNKENKEKSKEFKKQYKENKLKTYDKEEKTKNKEPKERKLHRNVEKLDKNKEKERKDNKNIESKEDNNKNEFEFKNDKDNKEVHEIKEDNKDLIFKKRGRKPSFKSTKSQEQTIIDDKLNQLNKEFNLFDDIHDEVQLHDNHQNYNKDNIDVTPVKLDSLDIKKQLSNVKLETSLKMKLKKNIMSILELSCNLPSYKMVGEYFEEKSVLRTAESIVLFCHKLNLSLPTLLTALVYLQLYKNSSKNWRSTKQYSIAKKNVKRRKFLKWDEQFLTSAACVLLAWKYKEDEIGLVKSTKKLFDISITLYKIIVSQSSRKTQNLSVSSWMLQDSGEEIKTLKSQIVDRENQLLHSLDYFIGPIPLPDPLISPYVKLFIISMADDFSDHQSYANKLEGVVSLLVVDFYKTQMCIDYTPNEIVVISIIKASCLLAFINPNDDICKYNIENVEFRDTALIIENKLKKFISIVGDKGLQVNRIVSGLLQIQKYSKIFKHSMTLKESF